MKDKRPVNLDIGSMRLPITAWASITHRASGVFLFVGVGLLLWALEASLSSPEQFASMQACFAQPLMKFILWLVMAALIYHSVAGVKHLVADFGIGETMRGGTLGAQISIAVSVVLALLAGIWLW